MEKKDIDLLQLAKEVWGNRKKVIKYGFIGGLIGIIIALSIPRSYTSEALIAPEEQSSGLSGSMGMLGSMMGVGGMGGSGIGTAIYPNVVKSRSFMMEFAEIEVENDGQKMTLEQYLLTDQKKAWWGYVFGLPRIIKSAFSDKDTTTFASSPHKQKEFYEKIKESVNITQDSKTNIFTISATFQNPDIANMVADSVLVKLQHYMQDYHTAKTRATLESNLAMLEEAKADYHKYDVAYALAADASRMVVKQSYLVKAERLRTQRDLALQLYRQVAQQVGATQLKLQEEQQILTIIEPPISPIDASAPNRPLVVVLWGFLGGALVVSKIFISFLKQE